VGEGPKLSWRFGVVLASLVALALALRLWALERCGLDHFDEGVYAFSASSIALPDQFSALYAGQEKFSPPAYFGAAGVLARLFGCEVPSALFALNAVLGAATVALLGLVARRWFGAPAGLAAAALLACNEYHIALSRTALTDVGFALAHLGAWFALIEALRTESVGRALAAGALVGLAWNVKYHGWLAVVAAALAYVPIGGARLLARENWRRPLALGVAAALTAALGYLPWALHVQAQPGGYAALAQYQSTMLRGGWFENLARQASQQLFFEGPLSAASVPLALACALSVVSNAPRTALVFAAALGLGVLGALVGGVAGCALLALGALPWLVGRALRREWPALAVLSGLALWALLTPFYHPYARLVLPLLLLALLAAACALGRWVESGAQTPSLSGPRVAWLTAVLAALAAFGAQFRDDPSDPWRASRGVERAASELAATLPQGARVFVLGDPALAWYLVRGGLADTQGVSGPECFERLERDARETFVACGYYPRLNGVEQRLVEAAGAKLALHARAPAQVKDVRLLDDHPPYRAARLLREASNEYEVRLYRYRP
jgi:4-amino-4-deoxy-L-arabinose transferase-like glycosyltransferase